MSHEATSRFGIEQAPGDLALVQDLINTRLILQLPDLLDDPSTTALWLQSALESASPQLTPHLPDGDVSADLRALRSLVTDVVGGHAVAPTSVPAAISIGADETLSLLPVGAGVDLLASAVWSAMITAEWTGTRHRLKICRNELCASAFYDRSRNSSAVWHDVRICGNAANLRASRERRRQREESGPQPPAQ